MKKRITQVEKQRQFIEDVKNRWFEVYDDSLERYTQNEFDRGLELIEIKGLPSGTEYSKTFWNWFKLQMAYARDEMLKTDKTVFIDNWYPTSSILKQIKDEAQSSIA